MSGFKRNFKAVRKDAAKVVRRRIEKRTHTAGARISEVAKLLDRRYAMCRRAIRLLPMTW